MNALLHHGGVAAALQWRHLWHVVVHMTPQPVSPCAEDSVHACAAQVQEQGEMAVRIDENVGDTLANVDNAQTQLLKYLNTVSSNRWLVMKIFAVLMIFATIFIVIS